MHPGLLELCLSFYSTTAQWMVQLVSTASESHDPQVMSCDPTRLFPLPDKVVMHVIFLVTFHFESLLK